MDELNNGGAPSGAGRVDRGGPDCEVGTGGEVRARDMADAVGSERLRLADDGEE